MTADWLYFVKVSRCRIITAYLGMAPWRSGYAEVCKTFYTGSIPVGASKSHKRGYGVKSVVVCGSKRYKDEIADFCAQLEKLGVLVFEPSFDESLPEDTFIHSEYVTAKLFKGLTLEHFDWIRKAEVCYVFNKDDYVGASVTMEMAYASALGKPVFAMSPNSGDPCRDALIDKTITSAKALAALL
jgi:hypothetical protein